MLKLPRLLLLAHCRTTWGSFKWDLKYQTVWIFSNELREAWESIRSIKVNADSSHWRNIWKGGVLLLLTINNLIMNSNGLNLYWPFKETPEIFTAKNKQRFRWICVFFFFIDCKKKKGGWSFLFQNGHCKYQKPAFYCSTSKTTKVGCKTKNDLNWMVYIFCCLNHVFKKRSKCRQISKCNFLLICLHAG